MNPAALLARAGEFGFTVEVEGGEPRLVRTRPGAKCPPALLAELRAARLAVVAHVTGEPVECGRCRAAVFRPELVGWAVCNLAGCPVRCEQEPERADVGGGFAGFETPEAGP